MSWNSFLKEESSKDYYTNIVNFVLEDSKKYKIYPQSKDIFNAFKLTKFNNTKVIILGQDPYHGPNQAHGLAFSVTKEVSIPPSLKNIFKELKADLGIDNSSGDLSPWASQGVFLLNSILTVRESQPSSHKNIGWEKLTDSAIKLLAEQDKPLVFILWGAFARSKKDFIYNKKHLIIESAHPSPLSAHSGFFGSKPFSKTNSYLIDNGLPPIDWKL